MGLTAEDIKTEKRFREIVEDAFDRYIRREVDSKKEKRLRARGHTRKSRKLAKKVFSRRAI